MRLTERQVEVLRWVADGCPTREWPDQSHKVSARALASRGLAQVSRKKKVWTATITSEGEYDLEHGESRARPALEIVDQVLAPLARGQHRADHPSPDATARAMRRVRKRETPNQVKQSKREIKEVYMRFKVVVTRVQVAERFVRATTEDEAAEKVQAEFDRPYGYFGSWITTTSEVDVVEAEHSTVIGPSHLSNDGPLLLSLKDAAKALGISYSTLYTMTNQGDIEWVAMGSRKYVAREALMEFIRTNSHKGYYRAR